MISSKATSTIRRTLDLLLLLFFSFSLYAADYRVGFVFSGSDAEFASDVRDAILFSGRIVDNKDVLRERKAKELEKLERAWRESENSAIRNSGVISEPSSSRTEWIFPEEGYSTAIVELTLSENDSEYLALSDPVAISYIKLLNDLDELVYVTSFYSDGLFENRIYIDGEEVALFLSVPGLTSLFQSINDFFLSRYRESEMRTVLLDGNIDAEIREDGVLLPVFENYLLLASGAHSLMLHAEGYDDQSIDYDLSSSYSLPVLSYNLSEIRSVPIFISTVPYTEEVFYQGHLVTSGYVRETTLPFVITASSPGFETRTVQSSREVRMMEVRMLPSAYYDPDRLERAKNTFYWSLLGTLGAFGLTVASGVVDNIYDADLSPLTYTFTGVSIISLVRMFESLFEYKDAAIMSI